MVGKKRSYGQTLALVIATMLVIVILGVGIYYLLLIFGGARQTASAVDAGSLNVAKVALLAPSIALSASDPTERAIQAVVGKGNNVNLLNFNKVVAWGLLVAANALADGSDEAKAEAKAVWMKIEGDTNNSLGAKLQKALVDPTSSIPTGGGEDVPAGPNWAKNCFNAAALKNVTAMANAGQQVRWLDFKTAYLGPGDSTNVKASAIKDNLPFSDINSGTRYSLPNQLPETSDGFIKGYKPIEMPGIGTFYFVTVYPDQLPGLRSIDEYKRGLEQPGKDLVAIPPNTFFSQADITVTRSNTVLQSSTPACVGGKVYPPLTSLKTNNYLIVDNSPSGTYNGPYPGGCQVVDCEELGRGIHVLTDDHGNGQLFSLNQQDLQNIKSWLDNGKQGAPPATTDTVYFYSTGSEATGDGLKALNKASPNILTCTDYNSDSSNAGFTPQCDDKDAFNNAYHPGGKNTTSVTVTGLTAAEKMKDEIFKRFHTYSDNHELGTLSVNPAIITGLGLYDKIKNPITNPNENIAWGTNQGGKSGGDQVGQCYCCGDGDYVQAGKMGKVTTQFKLPEGSDQTTTANVSTFPYTLQVGTAEETLIDTNPGPGKTPREALYRYFQNRCRQMGAEQTDIDSVWTNLQIDIGETRYVFINGAGKLDHSTTVPDSIRDLAIPPPSTEPPGLGGKIIRYKKQYNVFWNMVNAMNDFNVHDRMFTTLCQPGVMPATDSLILEVATGATGCLGRLNLRERLDNGPGPAPAIAPPTQGPTEDSYDSKITVVTGVNRSNEAGAPVVCEPD